MGTTATATTAGDGNGRRNRRRKGAIGIAAAAVAGALLVGTGYAYFSDSITGQAAGTAGTLDLTGTLAVSHTDGLTADNFVTTGISGSSVLNVNPGDVVKLAGTLTNAGDKSAWIRTDIKPGAANDPAITPYLYVFAGENVPTQAQLLAASDPTSLPGYVGTVADLASGQASYDTAPEIISGTGANAENDGNTTAGTGQYAANVEVYFDSAAPDAAQNQAFGLNVDVQAVQYRNNTNPAGIDWSTVETGTINTGTWTAAS